IPPAPPSPGDESIGLSDHAEIARIPRPSASRPGWCAEPVAVLGTPLRAGQGASCPAVCRARFARSIRGANLSHPVETSAKSAIDEPSWAASCQPVLVRESQVRLVALSTENHISLAASADARGYSYWQNRGWP